MEKLLTQPVFQSKATDKTPSLTKLIKYKNITNKTSMDKT